MVGLHLAGHRHVESAQQSRKESSGHVACMGLGPPAVPGGSFRNVGTPSPLDEFVAYVPVSYTHLDVYKRQPMNLRISALDGYALISNSDAHSPAKLGREANLLDIEPVSYTHLRFVSLSLLSGAFHKMRRITLFHRGTKGIIWGTPVPVSYTHLDVYKRQPPADACRDRPQRRLCQEECLPL